MGITDKALPPVSWIHSSREGTLITSKNVGPLDEISSQRRCGWIVGPKSTVTSSQGFATQNSRVGVRRKTSRHSLPYRSHKIVRVIFSQPISIHVGEKRMSVNCVGRGFDFMVNFGVYDLPASRSSPSSRKRSWLGCMEPRRRSAMLAPTSRWRFRHRPECKLILNFYNQLCR